MEKINYRIGLDVGVASIGWSVIENDFENNPCKIIDLGVRVFEPAEINEKNKSKPLALDRRIARGTRRRLRRMKFRIQSMTHFLCENFDFGVDKLQLNTLIESKNFNVYELRHKALTEPLSNLELAKLLLYFVKHRGYKVTSTSEENSSKEQSKMKKPLEANKAIIQKYLTIGEYIYQNRVERKYLSNNQEKTEYIYSTRNHDGEYTKCVYRYLIEAEIKTILVTQQKFNSKITDNFILKALEIFNRQLNYDQGPNEPSPYRSLYKVGNCTFIKDELRAPKGALSVEYFNALQKINQLAIIDLDGKHFLTDEQKLLLINCLFDRNEMTYKFVRKCLSLTDEVKFNGLSYNDKKAKKSPEEATICSFKNSNEIKKALQHEKLCKENMPLYDEIAEILSFYKSDDNRLAQFEKNHLTRTLTTEQKNNLLNINMSKFGNVSIKAIKQILPYLEQGLLYNEAVEKAGFNFSNLNTDTEKTIKIKYNEQAKEYLADITNPVVKRAIGQVIKVVNAIIDKYGSPQTLHIELARDIKKTVEERVHIKKVQDQRFENNKKCEEQLIDFGIQPTSKNLMIYKLYLEQGGKSPYSAKPILESCGVNNCDLRYLFDTNYVQVDHIVPYSKCFDDSWDNKVLVLTKENQDKKDRTPLEWLKGNKEKLQTFLDFVSSTYNKNKRKTEHLLTNLTDENLINEWRSASLNDTRTISKTVKELFEKFLYFAPSKYKRKVFCVNGQITNYLGKIWGIEKVRSKDDRHHARDACLIAITEPNMLQQITKFFKYKYYNEKYNIEKRIINNEICYCIKDTGEILSSGEYDKYMTRYVIQPYPNFREELIARLSNNPKNPEFDKGVCYRQYSSEEIDNLKPLFVSQMPKHKANGKLHDDTIYGSALEKSSKGIAILTKKVDIKKLKLTKDKLAIENYYEQAKQSDPATYEVLLKRLQEFDGDAVKAFDKPIYKPTKTGEQGNQIKKVKVQSTSSNSFNIEGRGVVQGGSLVRIDIFTKQGKYYAVPVYLVDLYKGILPSKVCSSKPVSEWDDISNGYTFKFSLSWGDLFCLQTKDGVSGEVQETGEKIVNKNAGLYYYFGFDRSNARITFKNHDDSIRGRSGFKNAIVFEKYVVDMLGNYHKVGKCKREKLSRK